MRSRRWTGEPAELVPGLPIDQAQVTDAARHATARFSAFLSAIKRPERKACGHWTSADVGAHVSHVLEWMITMARGEPSPVPDPRRISEDNERKLAADPQRDPEALATRIDGRAAEFFELVRSADKDSEVVWHGGLRLPLSVLVALQLGEAVIHGFDIAEAEGRQWGISPEDARLINAAGTHLVPYFGRDEVVENMEAVAEIRLRDGDTFQLTFSNGQPGVQEAGAARPDIKIRIDPVTWVLVTYGRLNPLRAVLSGRMIGYGRKPWLGLKLTRAFDAP